MAQRERDSRGRFVKKVITDTPVNNENDREHQILRVYNKLADGGHEYDIEDARKEVMWMNRSLYALFVIFALFLLCLLTGCGSKRIIEYVPVEKVVKEVVTVTDTVVKVELKPFVETVVTPDSTSHLENEYAYSDASVKDGMLNHTLGMKTGPVEVKTQYIHVLHTDSIPYPVPGPTQYVEKELSTTEKTLMGIGVAAIASGILLGTIKLRNLLF